MSKSIHFAKKNLIYHEEASVEEVENRKILNIKDYEIIQK
jgi:hypothetical protein